MLRGGDRTENILPAPPRIVNSPAGEADLREESVGDVRVLVQSDSASLPLREEGVRNAGEVAALEAARPAALARDVVEVEADAEPGAAVDRLAAAVEDVEPRLDSIAGDEVGDGELGCSDEFGADWIVELDVEDESGGGVGAVDVERFVPLRVRVVFV